MKTKTLKHSFVKFIPEALEDGVIYISTDYCTATHACMCGCGNKVVTPITPLDWTLTFDGETVSLSPSIGNWSFACQSHYWIKRSRVEWAGQWSKEKIVTEREKDKVNKRHHYEQVDLPALEVAKEKSENPSFQKPSISLYKTIIMKLRQLFKL